MSRNGYQDPEEHFDDHLSVLRAGLAIAVRRKRIAAGERAQDDELAELTENLTRSETRLRERDAATPPRKLPLDRLRRALGLTDSECRVLVLLTALEVDTGLREVLRYLIDDGSRAIPDVGLVAMLVYGARERRRVVEELGPDGRLFRYALVRALGSEDTPLALRRLRVADRVVELLHGRDVLDRTVARYADLMAWVDPTGLVLAPDLIEEVRGLLDASLAAARAGRTHPVVVISGAEGAGRHTLVQVAAINLGLSVLRVRCAGLPSDDEALRAIGGAIAREALLWRAVILLDAPERELDGGRRINDSLLGDFVGPVAAVIGKLTGRPPQLARGAVVIEVGLPDEGARTELWHRQLGDTALATWAAQRYTVSPGVIARAGQSARAMVEARRRGEPTSAVAVIDNCRSA